MSTREQIERAWDLLAQGNFEEAPLKGVAVGGTTFYKLFVERPPEKEFKIDVFFDTGLSFLAKPRFAAYRHRFVLSPKDGLTQPRWDIRMGDIRDLIRWSKKMNHVVTLSTMKSGAGFPFEIHAQSFPLHRDNGQSLTALRDTAVDEVIRPGEMPRFRTLSIGMLIDYPINGLRLEGDERELAEKTFELALNYDHLKAFNLVILPRSEGSRAAQPEQCTMHFFPRNRDGRAVYGESRWQIGAIEANGIMQTRTEEELASLGASSIREAFEHTAPCKAAFDEFLQLIQSF